MRQLGIGVLAIAGVSCSAAGDAPPAADAGSGGNGASLDSGAPPDAHANELRDARAPVAAYGPASPACSGDALDEPRAAITYYVAIGQPGADNELCDGLAATDEGGGHCPFKDLGSPRTAGLLDGSKGVRVELREGIYVVRGWDGLSVRGAGTSDAERVVLTGYRGEQAVLDVQAPDGAGCVTDGGAIPPQCTRQVVRLTGQYTVLQGLTIRNGLGYVAEINGGAHHLVRCNHFDVTAEFASRSDMLKGDGRVADVEIRNNEFAHWSSQAIDLTGVDRFLVEGNDFHDAHDADGGATGSKYGVRDIVIRNNFVHDLGGNGKGVAFSLGGTGSPHPEEYEAYRVQVIGNRIERSRGKLAQLVSCQDCVFRDNDASEVAAGVIVSGAATGLPECSASADGCKPTIGAQITGNRMRNFDGNGDPASANAFLWIDAGEARGLVASGNLYCAPAAGDARFGWQDALVTFAEWTASTGTDTTSTPLSADDARCAGW